jgi:hypothetical protein
MKHPFSATFGGALVALLLVGCASSGASASYPTADRFEEIHKPLSNGRTVTCLAAASGVGYAISCDWINAK